MNATASNATLRNASQSIAAIINGVMKDATTEGNRQAELSVAMFKNEVTYASDEILNVFRKEGADKTSMIDAMLSDASDDFRSVIDHIASIKDKASKERTTADVFTLDGLNRKARAARIMFERSLKSVYWLRENGCKNIATNKIGTGALKAKMPDPEDEGEFINETYTCNHVANKGNDVIREKLGKKAPETKARNPQANVLADASKALAAIAPELNKPIQNGKAQGAGAETVYDRLSDEASNNLEIIFKNVFAAKFFDGSVFDRKTLDSWIAETFKAEKEQAAAKNAGTKAA